MLTADNGLALPDVLAFILWLVWLLLLPATNTIRISANMRNSNEREYIHIKVICMNIYDVYVL